MNKLYAQKLCEEGKPVFIALDADFYSNRNDADTELLKYVINQLPVNTILFSPPAEPYFSIINYLAEKSQQSNELTIKPDDTETRTFLHDIPVIKEFSADSIVSNLKKRKAIVIKDKGVVSTGIVSPEQAFVNYSSLCFSCFVKFFGDLALKKQNAELLTEEEKTIAQFVFSWYSELLKQADIPQDLQPDSEYDVISMMIEAGKKTVEAYLVDSYFGNISFLHNGIIYISQTASSLDELGGMIDPCPIDNSATFAITASSEFSAHKRIYEENPETRCILHGHPKFTVIVSMLCQKQNCVNGHRCHTHCSEKRFFAGIPIIPGEVGTGTHSIARNLPPALRNHNAAIVYGHGIFATGKNNFSEPFNTILNTEKAALCYIKELLLEDKAH